MIRAVFATVLLSAMAATGAACAGPSLKDAWYVKADGVASEMLADRATCVNDAEQFGVDRASDFSNPEYGSLTALGAALDDGSLRGGAKQAVRRAVRDACMQKRGWTRVDPAEADIKPLKKASAREPDALQAWMAANAPKPAPVVVVAPPPAPASDAPTAAPAPVPPPDPAETATPKTPDPAPRP
jgi:hypothetical protein